MNDERSLVKQIKWLKQEINNLKIASEKGAGTLVFFSQTVSARSDSSSSRMSFSIEVSPITPGVKLYALPLGDVSGTYLFIDEVSEVNGNIVWKGVAFASPPVIDFYVLSTAPCHVETKVTELK